MASLFQKIKKITGNKDSFTLAEENPYEVKEWIDSGSYALNAVLSDGDIFKGLGMGKRYMLSGESGTAKSLFTTFLVKSFVDKKPNSFIVCFETEGSSVVDMAKNVGIAEDRIVINPVMTIEQCRTEVVRLLDAIIEENKDKPEDKKEHCIIVIDSVGMLSTEKEVSDISDGKDTKDMTRTQLLKGFARATSLKYSLAQTPVILVNHVYSTFNKYDPTKVSGGSGPIYMADVSLVLNKGKIKDEKDQRNQTGIKIRAQVHKSRYMRENKKVEIDVDFSTGMDQYSYLHDIAKKYEILKKEGISYVFPDGSKVKMKSVREDFKKYCTPELLQIIADKIKEEFSFG